MLGTSWPTEDALGLSPCTGRPPLLLLQTPMGKLFGEKNAHLDVNRTFYRNLGDSEARLTFSKEALILLNSCVL